MNKLEALKTASQIHNSIKKDIIACFESNQINIDSNFVKFKEITISQLRKYIESKIISLSNNELNMGLAFPIGINGDCIIAHYTPIKTPKSH